MEAIEPGGYMYDVTVTKYAAVGSLSVLIWDILNNIPADYRILFENRSMRKKLSLANCVYVFARIGALVYQLVGVIFSTVPVKNCTLWGTIAFGWCPLSIGATGLLFFLRLRAIYTHDRLVVTVFFALWIALFVSAILLPVGFKGVVENDTPYCTYVIISKVAFYSQLAPLVFDTLVFAAISWRLSYIGQTNKRGLGTLNEIITTMVFGTNLPKFTRGLLIDGQIYYLLTVIVGVASPVFSLSPLVMMPLSGLLQDSYLVLVNIMACRVFRHTRSEAIREFETGVPDNNTPTPIQLRPEGESVNSMVSVEVPAVP